MTSETRDPQEQRNPDPSDELLFPPGSIARIVARRPGIMAVAAGRAILMQLAHPSVAAGIDDHSTFKRDPLGRTMRTAEAFRRFFWRTKDEVLQVVPSIRAQHARVVGDGYSANDPRLLHWVHATTIDSLMVVYSKCVRPLEDAERASYYEEAKVIAELLGCPRDCQPDDLSSFDSYMAKTVRELRASDTGRSLARDFLFFPLRIWAAPIAASYRLLVCGSTPDRIRRELDIPWAVRHRASWTVLNRARVPLRALRRRREGPDPATLRQEGTCSTCGAVGIIVGRSGVCRDCARRSSDARMEEFERLGKWLGLERRS